MFLSLDVDSNKMQCVIKVLLNLEVGLFLCVSTTFSLDVTCLVLLYAPVLFSNCHMLWAYVTHELSAFACTLNICEKQGVS